MTASTSAKAVYDAAGHSDYVRRPKVDHHAAVGERLAQSLRVGVFEGDVAATGHMFAGRPDRDLGEPVVDQGDQEVRERERLLTQAVDSGLPERLDRPLKRAAASNGGVPISTHPPSRRGVLHVHLELSRLLVAPPPRQRGREPVVALGDEQRPDRARSGVEIFIQTEENT